MEMEGSADWTSLANDALACIARRLVDPQDFASFRAVCPAWREAVGRDAHARFQPWIVESDDEDDSGNVLFYSTASGDYHLIHLAALEGRQVVGHGAGLLVAVDAEDELAAVVVNPLTGESTETPRLPDCFRGTFKYGIVTEPEATGDGDAVVVVYSGRSHQQGRSMVALWRRGDAGGGWATMPSETFWMRMPEIRARRVLEAELAAADPNGGHQQADSYMGWLPGTQGVHLIEHEGQVRVLVRLEEPPVIGDEQEGPVRPGDPLPRVSFELRDTVAADGAAVVDWADAPELRDKIIFQSYDMSCYVLPASDGFTELGKNSVYFLSWQRQEVEQAGGNPFGYFLCKWDIVQGVATAVKKLPGNWEWHKPGKWFLPTFKY